MNDDDDTSEGDADTVPWLHPAEEVPPPVEERH
jgi:hypothetical protein